MLTRYGIACPLADCEVSGNGGNILKWARMLTTPPEYFAKPMTEMLLMAGNPVSVAAELLALRLVVRKLVSPSLERQARELGVF